MGDSSSLVIPVPSPGPGPSPSGGATLDDLLYALNQIYNLLSGVFANGGAMATIETISVSTSPTALYSNNKRVKRAVIQNLSSTDNLTLVATPGTVGKTGPGSSGNGIILNKASASGQGGGSLVTGNIDLGAFTVYGGAGSDQVAVYYET